MSYTNLNYHIVFSTKRNRPFLNQEIIPRLQTYLGGIVRKLNGKLLAANGPEDHLHLLVSLSPKLSLVDILRNIKANSSKWIHQTYPHLNEFAWQDGYSAFTVSQSGIDSVTQYIANQVEHHQKTSYQDELVTLLKRHQIDYDKRYLVL